MQPVRVFLGRVVVGVLACSCSTWAVPGAEAGVGSGQFSAHPTTPSFGAGNSLGLALGDIDGDLDLDIVVANNGTQAETVWVNDGSGSFSVNPATPTFGAGDSTAVALGDIDGDTDLDIVVANFSGQAETVWLNDGTGSFSAHPTPSFGAGDSTGLVLGDLDGDTDLDIVVANNNGQAETVWRNNGTGVFTAHPTAPSFGAGESTGLALGDLDGDGDRDVVVANFAGEAETVWLNNGTGVFTAHPTAPSFGAGNTTSVALGDLDGDTDLDVVAANAVGEAETVWLNNGTGVFTAHPTAPSFGAGNSRDLVLGNLDGDTDLDVVVANNLTAAETVWLNDGTGIFTAHPTTPLFGASDSTTVVLGDLDGDGDGDVVVANASGQAETVWLNAAGVDAVAPVIGYTSLAHTPLTTNRVLSVTIADASGVPTAGPLQPRIYFRKNAGSYASTQCALTSGTATSGTWSCTIDNALVGGVTAADVVQYFVIAQDVVGPPNIASQPAGAVAADVNTVSTSPGSPSSYTILPAATTTTLTSSRNPADTGDSVTFTATVVSNGPAPTGTVTFTEGAVLSGPTAVDGAGQATFTTNALTPGNHTIVATYNGDASTQTSMGSVVQKVVTATAVAPGDVIISELRFRGALGPDDEFVELYNRTNNPIQLKADGWALRKSDNSGGALATIKVIQGGITIPPRGYVLVVNDTPVTGFKAGELPSYPAGTLPPGTVDGGDAQQQVGIDDNGGVALFASHQAPFGTPLDAAGFGGYVEGAPLTPASTGIFTSGQHSFMRRLDTGGLPQDTNVNANDFVFISTTGAMIDLRQSELGNPNPQRSTSPRNEAAFVAVTMADPAVGADQVPNRVRDLTPLAMNGAQGSLNFRRKFTNMTGRPISRLRLRVMLITTLGSPVTYTPLQAELHFVNAPDVINVPITGPATIPLITGVTLEGPPGITMPLEGGLGSTGTVSTINLGAQLADGASVYLNMRAGVQIAGKFNFYVILEAEKQ